MQPTPVTENLEMAPQFIDSIFMKIQVLYKLFLSPLNIIRSIILYCPLSEVISRQLFS